MTALDGAFALAQVDHVAVMVAQDLDFHMARLDDEFFKINFVVMERSGGFARRVANGGFQIGLVIDAAHALSPASGSGFEQHGIAEGLGCRAASVPGTTGAPAAMAIRRAAVFEPIF
jgi:hypothetical protein